MANKAPKGWTGESLDLSDVNPEKDPPLPVGVYRAEIVDAEPHTSAKGGASIALTLEVHTRYGEEEGGCGGRKMFDYLGFEGFGAKKMKQIELETGVAWNGTLTQENAAAYCAELLGKAVWLRSSLEEGQDRAGNKTGEFNHKVNRYLTEAQCAEHAAAIAGNVTATTEASEAPVQRRSGRRPRAA